MDDDDEEEEDDENDDENQYPQIIELHPKHPNIDRGWAWVVLLAVFFLFCLHTGESNGYIQKTNYGRKDQTRFNPHNE